MEPKNSSTTKVIIAFVLGFVFGFAVSQTFLSERPEAGEGGRAVKNENARFDETPFALGTVGTPGGETDESGNGLNVGAPGGERVAGASAIAIESQPAGSAVSVKRLVLGERSWVAIHEDERGRPGKIMGAGRFAAGTHADVVVELLRPSASGGVYYGMIHTDNGDDTFDSKLDTHLADETGSPIMVRFGAL